jgi:hypothetical protein
VDDHGDYPPGHYVRNPPGSGHSPYSKDGCRILVKLRQFDPEDLVRIVIDTHADDLWQSDEGMDSLPLHSFGDEQVRMVRVRAGNQYSIAPDSPGTEIFVVSGSLDYDGTYLPAESWLRLPAGQVAELEAREDSILWVKSGHLPDAAG